MSDDLVDIKPLVNKLIVHLTWLYFGFACELKPLIELRTCSVQPTGKHVACSLQ